MPGSIPLERRLAGLPGCSLVYSSEEPIEAGEGFIGKEGDEAPAHQPGPIDPEELCAGEVGLQDSPVAVEGKVTHRGKVVEVGVLFQLSLKFFPGLFEFFVLQFQLDLVDLQLVDHPPGVFLRGGRSDFPLFPSQPVFSPATEPRVFRRVLLLFHGPVSFTPPSAS